jgi:hypothetical protein
VGAVRVERALGRAFLVFLLRYGPLLLAPSLEGSAAALWGPRPKFN